MKNLFLHQDPSPSLLKLSAVLSLVLLAGCQSRVQDENADSEERNTSTWNEQVQAVLSGETNEIRWTQQSVTGQQFQELLSVNEQLAVLEVDQSEVKNENLSLVLSKLPKLRQLALHGDVNNEQLQLIAENTTALTVLNLPHASIDDSGLGALTSIEKLELLRLHSSKVSDDGLAAIAECDSLRFLHLIDVPISDAGLQTIAAMEHLESFYLDGGNCTEEGLSELVRQRPRLHFHWNQLHLDDDPNKHAH